MIKIAIVEDEHAYAMQLQDYLHQYENETGEVFEISLFSDGDEIVNKYKPVYDVILMDVEMKFLDGMSAVEEIRKVDTEVNITTYAKDSLTDVEVTNQFDEAKGDVSYLTRNDWEGTFPKHDADSATGLVFGGIGITYQGACILAQTWNQDLALDFGHMDRRQMIEAGGDGSLRYYKDEEFTFDSESVSDYHYGREAAHHIYKPTKRQFARIAKKLAKENK